VEIPTTKALSVAIFAIGVSSVLWGATTTTLNPASAIIAIVGGLLLMDFGLLGLGAFR